jgi:hypothetical protein
VFAGAPATGTAGVQAFGSARASGSGRPPVLFTAPVRFTAPGAARRREVSPDLAASVSRVCCRERNGLRRYGLTIRVLPLKNQTRGRKYPRNRARRQEARKRNMWMILWKTPGQPRDNLYGMYWFSAIFEPEYRPRRAGMPLYADYRERN